MAVVRTVASVDVNQGALQQVLFAPTSPVFQAMQRAGTKTVARAKSDLTQNRLINTGLLRNSVESETFVRGPEIVSRVTATAEYAMLVHEGTSGPILPTTARVLRFKPKGATIIYRPQVRGTRETGRFSPFLTNALSQLELSDLG